MQLIKGVIIMGLLFCLNACAGHRIEDYKGSTPPFDVQAYFTGPIKAWGLVQDRSGKVVRRFDVTMVGTWKDGVGTLEEDFAYYDGKTQKRIWTLRKTGPSTYDGTAGDIVGTAKGVQEGSAMRWAYDLDLPVGGQTFRVTFDDWMFLMNDGVLINRSYIKKFGITMAELTLFMQKQDRK